PDDSRMCAASSLGGGSEAPLDRLLGAVRAEDAGADRVLQVAAEGRELAVDAADRVADAHGDGLAGALGVARLRPGAARETERGGELAEELGPLVVEARGAPDVVGGFGVVDELAQVADPRLVLAAGACVERGPEVAVGGT